MAENEKKLEKDIPSSGPLDLAKEAEMKASKKEGRRLKFNVPKSSSSRAAFALLALGGVFITALLLILLLGGSSKKKTATLSSNNVVEQKDLEENNNSEGYFQSPAADFGTYSLNLNLIQPQIYRSEKVEVGVGEQASLQDGFVSLVSNIERDYRPASEFYYKKIAESGDELVRVNLLVGNATNANMPIGYTDLAFYSVTQDGTKEEAERISEDVYSPKTGQVLGGKQTRKISLHFRVKRGSDFYLERIKTYEQQGAKEREGEEKRPTLNLRFNLK